MKLELINGNQISILVVVGILLLTFGNAHELVTLYDHNNGEGESIKLNVMSCTTMPRGWNQRVSSLLLMSKGCLELHESRICSDANPVVIPNPAVTQQLFDLNGEVEFNDRAMAVRPCSFTNLNVPASFDQVEEEEDHMDRFTVTLFEFVDRKGFQANVRVKDCASVPLRLSKNIASVDPRGNCVRLYSAPGCNGHSVQIQPNDPGSLNLHIWNFLDQTTSVGVCEDFQLLGMALNNKLRRHHSSPPLELSENLNHEAQTAAEVLANQSDVPHQTTFHSGILIYSVENQGSLLHSKKNLVREAISSWYEEQSAFDPQNPRPSPFTQLVWRVTKEVGIGVATSASRHRSVVVAKLSPAGNSPGGFKQNVNLLRNSF